MFGSYYGMSYLNGRWYAYNRYSRHKNNSRIISFCVGLDKESINPKIEFRGLPSGCHQIDFIDNLLYITDSYNNRIIVFDPRIGKIINNYFPAGELHNGRKSSNYVHCNSIFNDNGKFHLVFHNETKKTGKKSEIVSADDDFCIISRHKTSAGNVHNIYRSNERTIYCNSHSGTLVVDDEEVFRCKYFTRGLSLSKDTVVVGGSEFADRKNRETSRGAVFFLDIGYDLIFEIQMPAPVFEIRRVDKIDYCLSNSNSREVI